MKTQDTQVACDYQWNTYDVTCDHCQRLIVRGHTLFERTSWTIRVQRRKKAAVVCSSCLFAARRPTRILAEKVYI
jgi:RNase P subunit RPR2